MQDEKSIEIFLPKIKDPLIIDIDDLHFYQQYKWKYDKEFNRLQFVDNKPSKGKIQTIRLHRLIVAAPRFQIVDHINGNGMDNRRCNLRCVTQGQNKMNAFKHSKGSSKYKGVSYREGYGWRVRVTKESKTIHVGYFDNELDAAKAYDIKAKEILGAYANLNFKG